MPIIENEYMCRVCRAKGSFPTYSVREMMFGTRETFSYFQCTHCDCLQITDVPPDLAQYYPPTYYSFGSEFKGNSQGALQRWLQKQRCRTAVFGRGFRMNAIAKRLVPLPDALHRVQGGLSTGKVLKKAGIRDFGARFLDVGCGAFSSWLHDLSELGFDNLTGVDPYIESDRNYGAVKVFKRTLAEIDGRYDLITFHHSLEHMADQTRALAEARDLLTPGGTLLVRVPLVSSLAWERYGVYWVELDAPRHLYLHSIASLTGVASEARLELTEVVHDSLPLEFYGSEQYLRDIPLTDPRSLWVDEESTLFTAEEKVSFAELAKRANSEGRGGRAGFYFRAIP